MPTIWCQIMLNLSIITACIPSLKRILDAFRSGAAAASIASPYDLTVSKGGCLGWFGFKSGHKSRVGDVGQKTEDKPRRGAHREGVEIGDASGFTQASGSVPRQTNGHYDSVMAESVDSKVELDDQSQVETILPSEDGQSKRMHA
jgi:hypothetical protein